MIKSCFCPPSHLPNPVDHDCETAVSLWDTASSLQSPAAPDLHIPGPASLQPTQSELAWLPVDTWLQGTIKPGNMPNSEHCKEIVIPHHERDEWEG